MEPLTKGDIVLFPFPFTNLQERKLRPCLVLSDEMRDDVLLCQITSQQVSKDSYATELKHKDLLQGTLTIDSYIRTNMLFTAHRKQIVKKLCQVKDQKYKQVTKAISEMIDK
jgi:mRNA interferase MazF